MIDEVERKKHKISLMKKIISESIISRGITVYGVESDSSVVFRSEAMETIITAISKIIDRHEVEVQPAIDTLNTLSDLVDDKHE